MNFHESKDDKIELEIYCAQTYCYISDLMKQNWRLVNQIPLHRNTCEASGYVGDTHIWKKPVKSKQITYRGYFSLSDMVLWSRLLGITCTMMT